MDLDRRGSVFILGVLDPDLYWEFGSGSRSVEIDQNEQINLVSCLSKRYLLRYGYVFCFDYFLFPSLPLPIRIILSLSFHFTPAKSLIPPGGQFMPQFPCVCVRVLMYVSLGKT